MLESITEKELFMFRLRQAIVEDEDDQRTEGENVSSGISDNDEIVENMLVQFRFAIDVCWVCARVCVCKCVCERWIGFLIYVREEDEEKELMDIEVELSEKEDDDDDDDGEIKLFEMEKI